MKNSAQLSRKPVPPFEREEEVELPTSRTRRQAEALHYYAQVVIQCNSMLGFVTEPALEAIKANYNEKLPY